MRRISILRVAIAIGAGVDLFVAILALFFQQLLGPLLDVPTKDPALTTIAGGEYLVVALVYVSLLYDLRRYRMLLWLIALDQAFAVFLPLVEIMRGNVVATWKTLGPMPFNAALAIVYALRAPRRARRP